MEPSIKISLNLDKLRAINGGLENVAYGPTNDRQERVERSILYAVGIKLMKKQLDVFPKTKDFKFNLKYHEANALENFLRLYIWEKFSDELTAHLLRIVADEINQKLA